MSKWPDCEPDNPATGLTNVAFSDGYTQYKKSEVSPGKWQWIVDEDAMQSMRDSETKRRELYWALRSRLLTDEEMAEVGRHGDYLNIEPMTGYNATEKKIELNDALIQQFRFRAIAQQTAK